MTPNQPPFHRLCKWLDRVLPPYARLPLLMAMVWNAIAYYGARALTHSWPHFNMSLPIDGRIPFLPWTVSIYYASFVFWAVNYILCSRKDRQTCYRFLGADFLAKIICMILFILLPTTNVRPAIEGDSVWCLVMQFLYSVDDADNLFPSIHCLTSWFCFIGLRGLNDVPRWYRGLSLCMAIAIFISTMTTKQHVFVDTIAGVLLASACYWLTGHTSLGRLYGKLYERWPVPKKT